MLKKYPQLKFFMMGLVLIASLLSIKPAYAATITVGGPCTLIDAITSANTDTAVGGCVAGAGADTIILTGDVNLTAINNNLNGSTGLPSITSNITIDGDGFTVQRIGGSPDFRIFNVNATGTLTLSNVTISGGNANDAIALNGFDGGAIYNNGGTVNLTNNTIISNNTATNDGGAIENLGTLNISQSILTGNSAADDGGAIHNENPGNITIIDSTLSNNAATGGVPDSNGGAIQNESATGFVQIIRSTLNGNTAINDGGAIWNGNTGIINIQSSTLSNNIANASGGAIWNEATVNVSNSTIYDNDAGTIGNSIHNTGNISLFSTIVASNNAGTECSGTAPIDNNFNISTSAACVADTATYAALGLGALQNNGGFTDTHLPDPVSVVIDQGQCSTTTDQRGVSIPFDDPAVDPNASDACDIGAVEAITAPPPTVTFQTATTSISEFPGGTLQIIITLTVTVPIRAGEPDISATITVTPGTAVVGFDYNAVTPQIITFPIDAGLAPGDYSTTVSVDILDEFIVDGDKTVNLDITGLTGGAVLGAITQHIVTIVDNDIPTDTPTPTNTPIPTNTPVPVNTSVPPTTIPSSTPIPTNTSTSTSTATATNTATRTATSTSTATNTATATATVTNTATSTSTATATATRIITLTRTTTLTPPAQSGANLTGGNLTPQIVYISPRGVLTCQENGGVFICEDIDGQFTIINPDDLPVSADVRAVNEPFIQKIGNPPIAGPGEDVVYTIRVINPTDKTVTRVRVEDNMPDAVEILSSSATSGSLRITGQRVVFTQAQLEPGGRITITINSRISDEGNLSQIINRACLTSSGNVEETCAEMGFIRAEFLPGTGEKNPLARNLTFLLGFILIMFSALIYGRRLITI